MASKVAGVHSGKRNSAAVAPGRFSRAHWAQTGRSVALTPRVMPAAVSRATAEALTPRKCRLNPSPAMGPVRCMASTPSSTLTVGGRIPAQSTDQGREFMPAVSVSGMEPGFAHAAQASEQILDRSGQAHLGMGLELGQIQDQIRVQGMGRNPHRKTIA